LSVEVTLRNPLNKNKLITYYIEVYDTPLAKLWIDALKEILTNKLYLEKNFCFLGFPDSQRNLEFICKELNWAVDQINSFFRHEYHIKENFTPEILVGENLYPNNDIFNILHNHFEVLQGTVSNLSLYYKRADHNTKFAIRQLNNLCHEAESLILSLRKKITAPDWIRPSQITTFLNAKRYIFPQEYKNNFHEFRYDRRLGEVYLHWAQIGKTIYEVFKDENGADLDNTTCQAITHLIYYSGEFDIDWAKDLVYNGPFQWYRTGIDNFKQWLIKNNLDLNCVDFNYGYHPVGKVNLEKSFGTSTPEKIWQILSEHLDIYKIKIDNVECTYDYAWTDHDYYDRQIEKLKPGYDYNTIKGEK
jgi:hypothetical protein